MEHSIAGAPDKDDPQGEGGAIVVGGGVTAVLEDCLFLNNTAGKKVRLVCRHGSVSRDHNGGGAVQWAARN